MYFLAISLSHLTLFFLLFPFLERTVASAMNIIEETTCITFKPKQEKEKNFVEFVHGGG